MTAASDGTAAAIDVKSARNPDFKPTPSVLREQARVYAGASRNYVDPHMKRAFASAAFALAQLGECIERLTTAE